MTISAKFISVILHPLFTIFYLILIVLYPFGFLELPNVELQWITLSLVFLLSLVFPVLFLLVLYWLGAINSLKMECQSDRWIPYFFIAFYYIFDWYLLQQQSLFEGLIASSFLIAGIVLLCLCAVNFWIKISAHTLGICTILGLVLRLVYYYNEVHQILLLLLCLILSGLVASSRLYLKAHSQSEVAWASLLGLGLGLYAPTLF